MRRAAIHPVVLVILAALLALPSIAAAADTRPRDDSWPADAGPGAIRSAIEWREGFGLRADPEYVAWSLEDPVAFPNTDWGIPLSQGEVEDLAARLEVQRQFTRFIPNGWPTFAGAYIDQRRGGVPVFLFTEVTDEMLEVLERMLPDLDFEVHLASATLDELTQLKERISDAREELLAEGIEVVSVSVHVTGNLVEVGVVDATDEARARLAEFGGPIEVVEAEPAVLDTDPVPASPFSALWEPLDPADLRLRYYCESRPFTAEQLVAASAIDRNEPLVRDAFARVAGLLGAGHDWHIVEADDSRLSALAIDGRRLMSVELERVWTDHLAAEAWSFVGGGDCQPRTLIGRGIGGRWRLDPAYPAPGPRTRTLHVIGNLGCNGTERRGKARFHYTSGAVLIAIPMGSKVHSDMCHGLGPERMTITLPKPLGDRALYDVGSLPVHLVEPPD